MHGLKPAKFIQVTTAPQPSMTNTRCSISVRLAYDFPLEGVGDGGREHVPDRQSCGSKEGGSDLTGFI